MIRHIAAMTGLSGVGKSTFLQKLMSRIDFQHLQAGSLIREGRKAVDGGQISLDHLRNADIDADQKMLIHGFHWKVNRVAGLVILDGHSIIERDDGLSLIDPSVFSAIGIDRMVFLTDDPTEIAARRARDLTRSRPVKSVEDLRLIQDIAVAHAEEICRTLRVPLHLFRPDQFSDVEGLLRPYSPYTSE